MHVFDYLSFRLFHEFLFIVCLYYISIEMNKMNKVNKVSYDTASGDRVNGLIITGSISATHCPESRICRSMYPSGAQLERV